MLEKFITNKLQKLNKKFVKSGTNFLLSQCLNPQHLDKHGSFSINIETGFGFCYSCGYKVEKNFWVNGKVNEEQLEEIEREVKYKGLKSKFSKEDKKHNEFLLPPKSSSIEFLLKNNKYRGISYNLFEKLGVYFCDKGFYSNRIVFPINYENELKGFSTRTLDKDKKDKYLHSKGFSSKDTIYPYNLLKGYDSLVVTEGIFDTISLWEVGVPAICNFGVAVNFSKEKINELISLGVEELIIMLDKDKAGKEAFKNFENSNLTEYFIITNAENDIRFNKYYSSDCKDFNEYLTKELQ